MSGKSQEAKAAFILEQVERIEKIIKRQGGIVKAMDDVEGEMALLMGVSQIGEALSKLDRSLIERFDLAREQDGAYYTRNYIVHDYENVDRLIIEDILRRHLPLLKEKVGRMLQYLKQQNAF